MSDTRVISPVDEQRVREIVREELAAERYAILLMQGYSRDQARRFAALDMEDRRRIRAGELPPFNREGDA